MFLKILIRLSGQNLIIPLYHTICDDELPHLKHLYKTRTTELFKQDLQFLLKHFKPIQLHELSDIVRNRKTFKEPCFLLTFDDGLSQVYHTVWPMLKDLNLTLTLFLSTDFIDNKNLFFRHKASILIDQLINIREDNMLKEAHQLLSRNNIYNTSLTKSILSVKHHESEILDKLADILGVSFQEYLQTKTPYLTTDQIKELIKGGCTIGSHSINHPEYQFISLDEQLRQTTVSTKYLLDNFDINYKIFSFPHNDYKVQRVFFEKIYNHPEVPIDLTFGCAGLKKDVFKQNLQRIPVEKKGSLKRIISGQYAYFFFKIPFGKNRRKRK